MSVPVPNEKHNIVLIDRGFNDNNRTIRVLRSFGIESDNNNDDDVRNNVYRYPVGTFCRKTKTVLREVISGR